MLLVKKGKYIGFSVERRSCLLWSPVIVHTSSGSEGPYPAPLVGLNNTMHTTRRRLPCAHITNDVHAVRRIRMRIAHSHTARTYSKAPIYYGAYKIPEHPFPTTHTNRKRPFPTAHTNSKAPNLLWRIQMRSAHISSTHTNQKRPSPTAHTDSKPSILLWRIKFSKAPIFIRCIQIPKRPFPTPRTNQKRPFPTAHTNSQAPNLLWRVQIQKRPFSYSAYKVRKRPFPTAHTKSKAPILVRRVYLAHNR